MHSETQSLTSTLCTILLITLITLAIAVIPARTQNAIPPTARQAAALPAFAHRLTPPATRQTPRKSPAWVGTPIHRGRPLDGAVYDNGPVNGQVDAWTINFGFAASDTIQVNGPVTGIQFWAWLEPGDTATSVEVQIGSTGYFSNDLFDGVVALTQSNCFTDDFGFDVCLVSGNFTGPSLSGNDWITLANANTAEGNPLYWDENSGVGCQSPGCPSMAQENTIGTIPSEAFTLTGGTTTTTTVADCRHSVNVIHDFTGGADGSLPFWVAPDNAGNLYGTTGFGGNAGVGTAYKLVEEGSNWLLNTLYTFAGGAAGGNPGTPIIIGPNGSLYSTSSGGIQNCNGGYCGQVINLTPQPTACANVMCSWRDNILYQFIGGADAPGSISASDQEGNLYGTQGGGAYGQGAVFELTPSAGGWTKTVLYSFTGGTDGQNPGTVRLNNDGNLYGYADGGIYYTGVIFQLVRSENGWAENVIYQVSGARQGLDPFLVQDGYGNLYGSQKSLRTDHWGYYVDGVIYQLSQVNGIWTANEIYRIEPGDFNSIVTVYDLTVDLAGNFYAAANSYCYDECYSDFIFNKIFSDTGVWPLGKDFWVFGMAADAKNLYGTDPYCGAYGAGLAWTVPHN